MTGLTRMLAGPLMLAAMVLTGCSNSKTDIEPFELVKTYAQSLRQPSTPPISNEQIIAIVSQKALETTEPDTPLISIRIPEVEFYNVLTVIAENGPHSTWAPWGIVDRRSMVTKNGMITATRALGHDLMSANVDGVLALVQAREEGAAQYAQRYLNGASQILEAKSTCEVSRGYQKMVRVGGVERPALQMFSSCISANRQFVDLFLVDASGRILESRQWIGPRMGFATVQSLR
ncbi:MAG: YjbF family lipoprotein [Roseovarius sp.]|jgi:hypothetical protein